MVIAIASVVLVVLGITLAVFGGGNWITPVGPVFTAAAAITVLVSMKRARRKQADLTQSPVEH